MTSVFFGFGHGFGGTHLLAELLNIPSNVDCQHERKGPMSKYAMFDRYMDVFHGDDEAGRIAVLEERRPMIQKVTESGRAFGEANGILGFFVTALAKQFPNAMFIYTARDPRTQIRSAYNTGIFDKGVEETILKAHPDWDSVWWWPRPHESDPIAAQWDSMSNLEKCAWFWSAYNEFVLSQIDKIPNRVMFYKFEDMIKGTNIDYIYDFLDQDRPNPNQVQKIVSVKHAKTVARVANPLPEWSAQTEEQRSLTLKYVEHTMKKLGYEV